MYVCSTPQLASGCTAIYTRLLFLESKRYEQE